MNQTRVAELQGLLKVTGLDIELKPIQYIDQFSIDPRCPTFTDLSQFSGRMICNKKMSDTEFITFGAYFFPIQYTYHVHIVMIEVDTDGKKYPIIRQKLHSMDDTNVVFTEEQYAIIEKWYHANHDDKSIYPN
jgi:hypothetical protein